MRKIVTLSVIMVLCLAAAGQAMHGKKLAGKTEATIVSVDNTQKTMTVRDKNGTERVLYWDDSSTLLGKPMKEGETVHFKSKHKNGKTFATWIHVGGMEKESATTKSSPTKY